MNLTQKQERLALEIAHALDDMDSLRWHRQTVATYSEDYLRSKVAKALATPDDKVLVSRGAIYNSLIRGYGKHSRD